jgi:hypothetical protein
MILQFWNSFSKVSFLQTGDVHHFHNILDLQQFFRLTKEFYIYKEINKALQTVNVSQFLFLLDIVFSWIYAQNCHRINHLKEKILSFPKIGKAVVYAAALCLVQCSYRTGMLYVTLSPVFIVPVTVLPEVRLEAFQSSRSEFCKRTNIRVKLGWHPSWGPNLGSTHMSIHTWATVK